MLVCTLTDCLCESGWHRYSPSTFEYGLSPRAWCPSSSTSMWKSLKVMDLSLSLFSKICTVITRTLLCRNCSLFKGFPLHHIPDTVNMFNNNRFRINQSEAFQYTLSALSLLSQSRAHHLSASQCLHYVCSIAPCLYSIFTNLFLQVLQLASTSFRNCLPWNRLCEVSVRAEPCFIESQFLLMYQRNGGHQDDNFCISILHNHPPVLHHHYNYVASPFLWDQ